MCLLCVEIAKGMTAGEIARAYLELSVENGHHDEILNKIIEHSDVGEVTAEAAKISK